MAVQRRVAAKDKPEKSEELQPEDSGSQPKPAAAPTQQGDAAPGALQPRVALNIGLHSLLMLVVPLGLFFASSYGLLDRESALGACMAPRRRAGARAIPVAIGAAARGPRAPSSAARRPPRACPPRRQPRRAGRRPRPPSPSPAVYAKTFGIPREENKTLIGAVLAVLGVNAVGAGAAGAALHGERGGA
jgi:hypothetical protein